MKIKEMKEKTVEFVKENKAAIAVGGSMFAYGIGMYLWGRNDGSKVGQTWTLKHYGDDIRIGAFARELECKGYGQYMFDRFANEGFFNGKINSFAEAVKLLNDPENTKNITGIVICRKENN